MNEVLSLVCGHFFSWCPLLISSKNSYQYLLVNHLLLNMYKQNFLFKTKKIPKNKNTEGITCFYHGIIKLVIQKKIIIYSVVF